jgi:hypothetical protein
MKQKQTALTIAGFALALISLGVVIQQRQNATLRMLDQEECRHLVGAIEGKCCKPGRRWGCDPRNFGQSGCTPIENTILNCQPRAWLAMACTSAVCLSSNPEHVCSVDYWTVGRNVCHPTGERTTVGCPADQWQCKVEMLDYTHEQAPKTDVLVCRYDVSTICDYSYNDCD